MYNVAPTPSWGTVTKGITMPVPKDQDRERKRLQRQQRSGSKVVEDQDKNRNRMKIKREAEVRDSVFIASNCRFGRPFFNNFCDLMNPRWRM